MTIAVVPAAEPHFLAEDPFQTIEPLAMVIGGVGGATFFQRSLVRLGNAIADIGRNRFLRSEFFPGLDRMGSTHQLNRDPVMNGIDAVSNRAIGRARTDDMISNGVRY